MQILYGLIGQCQHDRRSGCRRRRRYGRRRDRRCCRYGRRSGCLLCTGGSQQRHRHQQCCGHGSIHDCSPSVLRCGFTDVVSCAVSTVPVGPSDTQTCVPDTFRSETQRRPRAPLSIINDHGSNRPPPNGNAPTLILTTPSLKTCNQSPRGILEAIECQAMRVMSWKVAPGRPTTRWHPKEEKDQVVCPVFHLRKELGTSQGTVVRAGSRVECR